MATKKVKTPKKSKKSTKKTYIAMVIDRSGSMSSIHKETVDGINEQFNVYRRDGDKGGDTEITLVQFDDHIDVVFDGNKPSDLVDWTLTDFRPRGSTAMYDGVWAAINVLKSKEETDDTGFLVCVISDGHENASKEITQKTLSDEIQRLQDTGKWTFTYMLANQDIHTVSAALNVPLSNVASYSSTVMGSAAAYTVNASSVGTYFGARSSGGTSTSNFFSDEDKKKLENTK